MRKTSILFVFAVATLAACNNAPEKTEAPKVDSAAMAAKEAPAPPPTLDSATKAKNRMEYMMPGEMHKMLAMATGKWNTEMTMVMEGMPPMPPSKGTCEFKMIMGGRYRTMTMNSDMMGMPFEGMGCIGYDNEKKMFMETWVDNMGTGMMHMEGTYDAATKTMETKGMCIDPETRGEVQYREVMKYIDDKNMAMEMYMTPKGGTEKKGFEMKFTKK